MACNLVAIHMCFGETCFLHVSESHDEIVEVNLIPSISDVVGSGQPHSLTSTVTNKVVHLFFWRHLSDLFGSILLCRGGHVYSLVLQTPESLSFYASQNHMKIYIQPFTFFTFFIFIYFQIWIVQYVSHNHVWTSAITTFCGGVGYFMMYQVQRFFFYSQQRLEQKTKLWWMKTDGSNDKM